MRLSEQQFKAITTIDQNVCVNAGAGSGKTEVLTRRFVEIYQTKKVGLDSIICITFTKKASAEMKDRIQTNLQHFPILREQMDLKVSTVHSFCKDLIARYSYELDIDPRFTVMEEREKAVLIQHIIDDLFKLSDYQAYAFEAAEVMDLKGVDEVKELLSGILNASGTFNWSLEMIEQWTISRINAIESFKSTDRIDFTHLLIEALDTLRSSTNLKKYLMQQESSLRDGSIVITKEFVREIIDRYKSIKTNIELKERVLALCHKYLITGEIAFCNFYTHTFDILRGIQSEILQRKKKLGKVDFNDLENYALKLLKDTAIRKEIQRDISYIMIDEFQDTSDIQKEIFEHIVSDKKPYDRKNLFVVGDPKQAIYGFRGANIDIFENTRDEIINAGGVYITFEENFRSQKEIMEVVNDCYEQIMDTYDPLRAMRERKEKVSIIRWEDNSKEKFDKEAYQFAISVTEKESEDYAVLFRTKKEFSVLEDILREKNIPFYSMGTENFELQFEVLDFINFLHYYFYKDQLSFIGILQNYYDLSYSEIYEIMNTSDLEENPNVTDLNNFLALIKEKSAHSKISEIVLDIIEKYELYHKYRKTSTGEQEQANIYQLFEIAIKFDREGSRFKNYFDFLAQMKKIKQKQLETEESQTVKLMTIHGSKGLGFKNVYIPRLNYTARIKAPLFSMFKNQGLTLKIPDADISYLLTRERLKKKEQKEEDNIYYTAMTRAKDKLVLGLSGNKGGYKKKLLPIIDKMKEMGKIQSLQESDSVIKRMEEEIIIDDLCILAQVEDDKSQKTSVTSFIMDEPKDVDVLVPANPVTSIDGEVIHRFAEIYDGDKEIALSKVFKEYGQSNVDKRFETYADFFIQMNSGDIERVEKEVSFYIKIQDQIFSGIIDRVEFHKDCIRIIDYKLSNRDRKSLYETYYLQLAFYGFVLEKRFYKKINLELQNLKRNYKIRFDYDTVKNIIEERIYSFVKQK